MTKLNGTLIIILICLSQTAAVMAMEEGTRHITGNGVDVFFMNDKLFGTIKQAPLWSIYNCGSDIKGEIDISGTYHKFDFLYHQEGDRKITGTFGSLKMALGKIEKKEKGFIYQIFIDDKEYSFSIRYEQQEGEHMVNSLIQGELGPDKKITLKVDGHLCPFGTTGIIMLVAGAFSIL